MYMLPVQSHVGPQLKVQHAVKEICHPSELAGAQHAPVMRPPFTFSRNSWPGFELSSRAHAGPRAAAVDPERVGLLVSLSELSMLLSSSQILATRPVAAISAPMSRL
jgi:hypothetical protein